MKIPDLARLNKLIDGAVSPEGSGEMIFLEIYTKSMFGEPLVNIIIDEQESISHFTNHDLNMLVLGYALGQQKYVETTDELETETITDGSTVH